MNTQTYKLTDSRTYNIKGCLEEIAYVNKTYGCASVYIAPVITGFFLIIVIISFVLLLYVH